jgi:hypothetical protein
MWDVLFKSLAFIIFIVAVGAAIFSINRPQLKLFSLLKNKTTKEPNIKITEKRIISPQQSLIEVQWRGTLYLIHLNQNQSTLLDSVIHKE